MKTLNEKIREILGEDAYNYGAFQADDNEMRFGYTVEELEKIITNLLSLFEKMVEEGKPKYVKIMGDRFKLDFEAQQAVNQYESNLKKLIGEGK